MQFGFCYIPDYYPDLHGDFSQYYERLLSEWELADQLGYDAIWLAEHRYPGYAFSSLPVVAQADRAAPSGRTSMTGRIFMSKSPRAEGKSHRRTRQAALCCRCEPICHGRMPFA